MTDPRAIHLTMLDKRRPALVLSRHWAIDRLNGVVVAPITSTVRGLDTELPVGPANGLDREGVVNLDGTSRVTRESLGRPIGFLLAHQERALTEALLAAFDLQTRWLDTRRGGFT